MIIDTDKLEEILAGCGKMVIVGHYNPDGDCVGSTMGFFHYVTGRGISASVILPTSYSSKLKFLDPAQEISVYEENPGQCEALLKAADVIVCLDLNSLARTDAVEASIRQSKAVKVLIDHHPSPERESFNLVFSMTGISSASELLFWILMNMRDTGGKVSSLDRKTAEALYTGMMTDTNNFSNSVFPSTFEMASMLIARGVNKQKIEDKVLRNYSFSRMQLMGRLLDSSMKLVPEFKAAYMLLDNKTKRRYRFKKGDSEGFVNLPLESGRVRISALFTEDSSGEFIRVSLRSKGKIDVNAFARAYFNGGGHVNASGGRLEMDISEVPAYFEDALKKFYGA